MEFYERLGVDPATPTSTFRLAKLKLGPDAIERAAQLVGAPARLFTVRGEQRIAVNRRIPVAYQLHAVGHELGHLVLEENGYREDDVESVCDAFGAALLAPMPAVRALLRAFGRDHEAIADEVVSTQTWAALRIAEVLGIPRAVLTPQRVYARGPETFEWCAEEELRRLAKARSMRPGLARARLTDDPRRVVLDVEEVVS